MAKASIVERIPIDGAEFLNDISIDNKGVVYVSDMKQNKIHTIKDGKVSLYMEAIQSANGLCVTKKCALCVGW
jgi:uncharacterized protein related to proFAR isomerase